MRRLAPALLLLTAATQQSPNSQVDWHWVRDTPMCSLRQAYSPDGGVVQISRAPANDATSIRIGRAERIIASSRKLGRGKVTFIPGGEFVGDIFTTPGNGHRDLFASSDDPAFLRAFAEATSVEFKQEEIGSTRVPLRSTAAALEAIQRCEDSRMREWGMDPAAWRALRVRPAPSEDWSKWIGPDDYPIDALLSGSEGFMILRLKIGASGAVHDCQRLIRGQPVQQQVRLCSKLKKRARFKPAVASNGESVASPYVLVVNFVLR